jgi:prenyltransferase beta subunit
MIYHGCGNGLDLSESDIRSLLSTEFNINVLQFCDITYFIQKNRQELCSYIVEKKPSRIKNPGRDKS